MHSRSGESCVRLPVRAAPAVGESLQGYLLRLAEANGYRVPWIMRCASIPRTYASTPFDLGLTSLVFDTPADAIFNAACWPVPGRPGLRRLGGQNVPAALVFATRKRVCPACVSSDAIVRQIWQVIPVVACPKHGSLLVDECPACVRPLNFLDVPIGGCRCGWRIDAARQPVASSAAICVAAFLHRAAGGEEPRHGEAPVIGLEAAARLVWLIAGPEEDGRWRSVHMSKPSVVTTAALLEAAAPVLLDWPAGLHQWLAERRRDVSGRVGLSAEFGTWYGRLSNVLRVPGCEAVAEETRSWLLRRWGRRTLKHSSFLAASDCTDAPMTIREAATRLTVSPTTVTRMIADGRLRGNSRPMGRRTQRRILQSEVERGLQESLATLDAQSISNRIGLSVAMVARLRRKGLLRAKAVSVGGKKAFRYEEAAIGELTARLAEVAIVGRRPDIPLRLTDLPARRQVQTVSALDRVLAGTLRCFHAPNSEDARLLASYVVSAEDLIVPQAASENGGMSVREAAKVIGVSVRMIPVLVNCGCISAITKLAPGKAAIARRGVSSASLRSFRITFTMTSEIAKSRGTNTRAAMSELRARGVQPLIAPDLARGISAVWKRSDVEEWLR